MEPFLAGKKRVDVVIMSFFFEDACLGFVSKLEAPFVFVSTTGNWPHLSDAMDFTEVTSVVPSLLLTHSNRMTFLQRVKNTVMYHGLNIMLKTLAFPKHEAVLKKNVGQDRDLDAVFHNASLAFLNTVPGMDYPNLYPPNLIQVGGMHCVPSEPLPKVITNCFFKVLEKPITITLYILIIG